MKFSYTKADILKEATKLRLFLAMLLVASFSFIGYSMASNTLAASYTITFNPQGGTFGGTTSNTTKTVSTNSTTNSSVGVPTRTGYTFGGWYLTQFGGGLIYDSSGAAVPGPIDTPSTSTSSLPYNSHTRQAATR